VFHTIRAVPGEGEKIAALGALDGRGTYTTEKLLRLPGLAWVYDEPLEARAVGALPAERNGYVTFLCANNPLKVTPEAVAAWAKILAAVPGSRLTMLLDEKGPQSARGRSRGMPPPRTPRRGPASRDRQGAAVGRRTSRSRPALTPSPAVGWPRRLPAAG
jgi:hypothetical protein